MPVDIDELKKKREELRRQVEGGKLSQKLKWEGDIWVRILPPWKPEASFYAEVPVHYLPMPDAPSKSRPWQCLRKDGKQPIGDCPLCQIERALFDRGGDNYANEAKAMKRKPRFVMNVLERDTGEVKVLICGPELFGELLTYFCDPHYGNITKPDTGTDMTLTKKRTGSGRRDVKYSARPVPNSQPLKDAEWKGKLYDLDKEFRSWTKDQLIAAYKGEEVEGDPGAEGADNENGSSVALNEDEAQRQEMQKEGMVQPQQQARPRCFGSYDAGDASCAACPAKDECQKASAPKEEEKPQDDDVRNILDEINRGGK